MGILDRLRGRHTEDTEGGPVVEPPIDREARRAQLDELEESLRQLARAMADRPERMSNPGWRGRVEDYRYAANEAAHIARREFQRSEVLDIVNQIRPLYPPGVVAPSPEYLPFEAEQTRLLGALHALRQPLPSESV